MDENTCKICGLESPPLNHYWKTHKIKASEYFQQYFPKFDLLTSERIVFRDADQYFSDSFASVENFRTFWKNSSSDSRKAYVLDFLSNRKSRKNLIFAPTQVELMTYRFCPGVISLEKVFGCYFNLCSSLGFKRRFRGSKIIEWKDQNGIILIDSREQKPLFPGEFELATLPYGDYCLKDNAKLYIERKNGSDFIGSFSNGFERLKREGQRCLNDRNYLLFLVEIDLLRVIQQQSFPDYLKKFSRASVSFIFHNVRAFLQEFPNSQFLFCSNRAEAERLLPILLGNQENCMNNDLQLLYEKGII